MSRLALILAILGGGVASGQAPAEQTRPLAFEVASVKPADSRLRLPGFRPVTKSGQWFVQNSTVAEIIRRAFPDFALPGAVVGGPAWAHEERFTIDARAPGPASLADLQAMARHLLTERFHLRTQIEQRPVDFYALMVAREDGRLGRGLRPASAACTAARKATPVNRFPAECQSDSGQFATGTHISERGWYVSQLVAMLQAWLGRRVIDRTGLTGLYDMEFVFDFASVRGIETPGATAPSIFTALQEDLGLKLEPSREPMDVLVIESVERPTPN